MSYSWTPFGEKIRLIILLQRYKIIYLQTFFKISIPKILLMSCYVCKAHHKFGFTVTAKLQLQLSYSCSRVVIKAKLQSSNSHILVANLRRKTT